MDECSLLATKKALLYLALESLNAYFGKQGSFSLYEFTHVDSVVGIDSIEVAPNEVVERSATFTQTLIILMTTAVVLAVFVSLLVGAFTILSWF